MLVTMTMRVPGITDTRGLRWLMIKPMRWPVENSAMRRSPKLAAVYVVVILLGVACQIAVATGAARWLGIPAAVLGLGGFVLLMMLIVRNDPPPRTARQHPPN